MPRRSAVRKTRSRAARTASRTGVAGWWQSFQQLPPTLQLAVALAFTFLLWLASNWIYQVARKPSELFFPVSGTLYRTPTETWRSYGHLFRAHSTPVVTADLLAAIAQVEGSGNPIVRTYWRWVWTAHPFEVWRPASSAVGMYQITDGTFDESRRYCIRNHAVAEDGPWYAWRTCWFNALYTRTVPGHSVELTSAWLDRNIARSLERRRVSGATLKQKQQLAAVIHLCGAGAGDAYARRRFRLQAGQRCGAHEVRGYLARIAATQAVFRELALTRGSRGTR